MEIIDPTDYSNEEKKEPNQIPQEMQEDKKEIETPKITGGASNYDSIPKMSFKPLPRKEIQLSKPEKEFTKEDARFRLIMIFGFSIFVILLIIAWMIAHGK